MGVEVFTYKGKNIVGYCGFKNHFAIWFYNGVFLKDPYKVLYTASEGKTKALRQWRFNSLNEVDERKILEYVQEAVEVENQGLKIEVEKPKELSVPAILKAEFKKDKKLEAAFNSLTMGKCKEYILHLDEAKQEATKLKRFAKIVPLILEGKGLNYKYKK